MLQSIHPAEAFGMAATAREPLAWADRVAGRATVAGNGHTCAKGGYGAGWDTHAPFSSNL